MVYFIACIRMNDSNENSSYMEYIREVKPIVEQFGGRYLIRSDKIMALSEKWRPDRVIVIEWDSKSRLEECFSSEIYLAIAGKRERAVESSAIIVEG